MTYPAVTMPNIYIVDDDKDVLKSTSNSLSGRGWEVKCFTQATDFLEHYVPEQPGCLVLDLQMPGMNGLELQQRLSELAIDVPIIFVTGAGSIAKSVTALKAGAVDFIEKPFTRSALIGAINKALDQQEHHRREKNALDAANNRFSDLTEREWEVLTAMVSGPNILSSKEVARALAISHRTVEHHRAHIMDKTGSRTLPELIRLASFIGIANPELGKGE